MEKTKQIAIIAAISVLSFIMYSCKYKQETIDNYAMIDHAESCVRKFNEQGLCRIIARNNYYYCIYNSDSNSYIVPTNYLYVRQINNDSIKTIYKESIVEQSNSNKLIVLLEIVQDLHQHDICDIEVNADTIRISKFNGYYLTNNSTLNKNNLRKIKDHWYSNK